MPLYVGSLFCTFVAALQELGMHFLLEAPNTYTYFFLLFTFYNCIVPMGFLTWEIRVAFPRGKTAATESCYPT